jgi:hypothetical protein
MSVHRTRLVLESSDFIVEISANPSVSDLVAQLRREGGYGITHVGVVRRRNGRLIGSNAANDLMRALHFFFAFCKGCWCGPILCAGRNSSAEVVWEEWADWKAANYSRPLTWFPLHQTSDLSNLFNGFMELWKSEEWRETLVSSIHWYIVSNSNVAAMEGSIILTQVALELLAWTYLVDSKRYLSVNRMRDMKAHEQIERLLHELNIPSTLPTELTCARRMARKAGKRTGPELITYVRNKIVHGRSAGRKRLETMTSLARFETREAGQLLIELALLRLMNYDGRYARRTIRKGWVGSNIRSVPWN